MKKKIAALSAVALSLSLAGCTMTTPISVGTIGDVEIPAGVYLLHQYNDSATLTDHLGFVFDTTNVSNEVAACSNVYSEYKNNLQNGLYESQEETEAMLDEFLAKLQANGLDTLKTECQAQIDAWTAAQAK